MIRSQLSAAGPYFVASALPNVKIRVVLFDGLDDGVAVVESPIANLRREMPPDQAIPVAETAHRLENVELRAFQVGEMREHIAPDEILQMEVVGGLSPLMVAIGDRIEMLALPFDEVVVLLAHFLAYGLPNLDACADVGMRNGAMLR